MDSLILRAAKLAAQAHEGQTRKYTNRPYVEHPARVAGRVALRPDATEDMVAAAFLHDVVEDTEIKLEDIRSILNPEVARLVGEMTNTSKITDPKLPRAERKKMDRDRLAQVSYEVKIIKLLDRIDNVREMTGAPSGFIRIYAEESLLLATVIGDADIELKKELIEAATDLLGENIKRAM